MADNPEPIAETTAAAEAPAAPPPKSRRRRRLFGIVAIVVLLAAVAYGVWAAMFGWRTVSTDNAYVGADVAQVTPLVGAPVAAVLVQDTQSVRAGDVLVRLDPADLRIAVEQAQANLLQAQRRFGQTLAQNNALSGTVEARVADIGAARAMLEVAGSNVTRAQVDYDRRNRLAAAGAVSGDELTAATTTLANARSQVAQAQSQLAQATASRSSAAGELSANQALTRGLSASTNPEVAAARAALDQARLNLTRAEVRAPVAGVIARRNVQVGQRLAAGVPIMSIVPIDALYVDANFKEGQLDHVAPDQPVTLTSDLYGDDVVFHGRIIGFGGGTGAAFSLIPAQNATGNWIKVVQRLPVRVALVPAELRAHPLRVGLSMEVDVDVSGDRPRAR